MTNPSLFNGDVRHDVSGGPVRNTPQVTKSEPACNPRVTLALAVTLAPTPSPSKVHDGVRVGG